jgi:hypothetical protein
MSLLGKVLRMENIRPGGGGAVLVSADSAWRRRFAHAGREPKRRREVHAANIGLYAFGVVPAGSKGFELRTSPLGNGLKMVSKVPSGGGEVSVGANVARWRQPANARRTPQRRLKRRSRHQHFKHSPFRARCGPWRPFKFSFVSAERHHTKINNSPLTNGSTVEFGQKRRNDEQH